MFVRFWKEGYLNSLTGLVPSLMGLGLGRAVKPETNVAYSL